jgi:hypothetical protein
MNPSQLIDEKIASLDDWRGKALARVRKVVHDVEPKIVEEWKWGTAVWSHDGLVLAVGVFKDKVKVNFFQGASIPDPNKLFNAGLESEKARVIDLAEDDEIDEPALKSLIRAAVAFNAAKKKKV